MRLRMSYNKFYRLSRGYTCAVVVLGYKRYTRLKPGDTIEVYAKTTYTHPGGFTISTSTLQAEVVIVTLHPTIDQLLLWERPYFFTNKSPEVFRQRLEEKFDEDDVEEYGLCALHLTKSA